MLEALNVFLGESNIRIYFGSERNETEILHKDQVAHSVVVNGKQWNINHWLILKVDTLYNFGIYFGVILSDMCDVFSEILKNVQYLFLKPKQRQRYNVYMHADYVYIFLVSDLEHL